MVGREGLEPSMFLMSRIYSPLVSPLTTPTHMLLAPNDGIEPSPLGSKPSILPLYEFGIWRPQTDSNDR